jgi:hypothetical protein
VRTTRAIGPAAPTGATVNCMTACHPGEIKVRGLRPERPWVVGGGHGQL